MLAAPQIWHCLAGYLKLDRRLRQDWWAALAHACGHDVWPKRKSGLIGPSSTTNADRFPQTSGTARSPVSRSRERLSVRDGNTP
jgi:hypothetical protein